MDLFFGLIGTAGFVVFGIMGLIAAGKKTGKAKKYFTYTGISFILLAFGLAIAPDPVETETASTEVKTEVEEKDEELKCDADNVTKIANQKNITCEEAKESIDKAKAEEAERKELKEEEQAKEKAEQEKIAQEEEAKKKAEAEAKADQEAKLAAEKKAKEEAEAKKAKEVAEAKKKAAEKPKFVNAIAEMNPDDVAKTIKSHAKDNWPDDFIMQQFEIEEQTKAYEKLKLIKIDSAEKQGIMDRASSNWRYDFIMIEFEYTEQLKAMEGL